MALESVKWGEGRRKLFLDWIDPELRAALSARQSLEATWRDWLTQYRAPSKQPIKRFPYDGAPNYMLPITATDVDPLIANFMTTIHAPDNLWTLKPMNERWLNASKPLQDFLAWLDKSLIKMWDVNYRAIPEMVKLGTAVYKTGWFYEKRGITTYNGRGGIERVERIMGFPFCDHVRCVDFIIPAYSYAIDPDAQGGAPWVAERLEKSESELRMLAQAGDGFLPAIDPTVLTTVINGATSQRHEHDVTVQKLDYSKRMNQSVDFDKSADTSTVSATGSPVVRKITFYEIHARFATEGDVYNDIVVWYDPKTYSILRAIYQPYGHGKRPYEAVRYFRGEGFWGIGVCEQKEMFQKLQSQLMNDQLINVELANARMWAVKQGANVAPGEPIYPGKVLITDGNPRDEVMAFQMGDIYSSLPATYQMIDAMAQRRTGISDIQLGNLQQLPGRTPATTMLSLMQEGNKRPDLTMKDMRNSGLSVVGLRLLQLCQQYMQEDVIDVGGEHLLQLAVNVLGMPEGMEAGQKLAMPMEDVALGLGVSITATSGSANKEVERQGNIALLQLAAQIYPQYIQLGQVAIQAQQMPGMELLTDIAVSAMRGTSELFLRTLEQFDVRNPEVIVPQIGGPPDSQAPGGPGGGPNGAQGGPGGGAGGFDPAALMALLAGGAGGPAGAAAGAAGYGPAA